MRQLSSSFLFDVVLKSDFHLTESLNSFSPLVASVATHSSVGAQIIIQL